MKLFHITAKKDSTLMLHLILELFAVAEWNAFYQVKNVKTKYSSYVTSISTKTSRKITVTLMQCIVQTRQRILR